MWITNESNNVIDFYINKRYIYFKAGERKNLEESFIIALMERLPYGGWKLEQKDIAYITKSKTEVTIYLKSGKKIVQRKPEELRFLKIKEQMDKSKIQIAIFMKNIITHYSGGRYWAWLLGHILADDPRVQVTFITNQKPPFGKSFECYDNDNVFIYLDDPKNIYRMGEKIPKNVFDCIVGIPIEGGMSAQIYAEKWGQPYSVLLFESPNFIRKYRGGPDSEDITWQPYKPVMEKAFKIINNTEMGKQFLDEWMGSDFDKKKSVWLWNSINTKVANLAVNVKKEKDVYHLIFVGRLLTFKRIVHIPRALNLIKDKKFVLHLISGRAGSMVEQMEKEADPHVEIKFHDKVDDHEKFKLIKMCDMMVFLSSFEGFGIPPAEALYCKTLCIAYPLPILKMIYKDHLIYAKDGDIEDVAHKIQEWIKDSKKRTEHIEKAKKYIDGVVSHDRVRKEFFQITGLKGFKKEPGDKKDKLNINFLKKDAKLTFGIIVCNGAQFITENLKHIYEMADEIIICEGAVGYFNKVIGSFYSNDGTIEKIRDFQDNNDPGKKIKLFSARKLGRCWKDKMEMQNKIAENTTGEIFIKQDVDEFYDKKGLMTEIDKLQSEKGRCMINYRTHHFWNDFKHVIVGANFNDKQTRIWKWRSTFRYLKTFNWVTDIETNQYTPPDASNSFVSEDHIFHYNYIYKNKARLDILKYYSMRGLGDHKDVSKAWMYKNPDLLQGGRRIEELNIKHPVSDEILEGFIK